MIDNSLICPDCGAGMTRRESRFGPFYGCIRYPACQATHGAHPDGTPLGIPADAATKQARIRAHRAFDFLWNGPARRMTRDEAYRWLAEAMHLPPDEAHIGRFDSDQCARVVALCNQRMKQR